MKRRCVVCNARAVHRHHIVYRQHLRRYGGSLTDERNLLDLCHRCHGDHHSAARKIPVWMLPREAFEFMSEIGIEGWYPGKYYASGSSVCGPTVVEVGCSSLKEGSTDGC